MLAAGIAVGSGVAYAGVLIGLRVLRGASSRWLTIFNHLFAAAALAPSLFFFWKATPSPAQLVTLFLFGSVQMALAVLAGGARPAPRQLAGGRDAHACWNRCSIRCGPSSSTGKSETPSFYTLIGGACILAALAWRYWPSRTGWRKRSTEATASGADAHSVGRRQTGKA